MKSIMIYDEASDSLLLRKSGAKVAECLNDGNDVGILELDKKKNIVGLELLDIHKTFSIPIKVLKNIKRSIVNIRYEKAKKIVFMGIILIYEKEKERFMVPIMADLGKSAFACRNFMTSASC